METVGKESTRRLWAINLRQCTLLSRLSIFYSVDEAFISFKSSSLDLSHGRIDIRGGRVKVPGGWRKRARGGWERSQEHLFRFSSLSTMTAAFENEYRGLGIVRPPFPSPPSDDDVDEALRDGWIEV